MKLALIHCDDTLEARIRLFMDLAILTEQSWIYVQDEEGLRDLFYQLIDYQTIDVIRFGISVGKIDANMYSQIEL